MEHQVAGSFLYQIFYDESSKRQLDSDFIPLDNSSSLRPEWFELWPIRNYLLSTELQEEAWYGFLSPKFNKKFGLSAAQVLQILDSARGHEDVVLFSPHWDQSAYFINAFEQGDFWTPGLLSASQQFVDSVGLQVNLNSLVGTSQSTVFSNYFAAKPIFWRKWLDMVNELVKYSETDSTALGRALNSPTRYESLGKPVALKTFIQERIACLLLSKSKFRVGIIDMSDVAPLDSTLFVEEPSSKRRLQACDVLKRQYLETSDPEYINVYWKIRRSIQIAV